LNSYLENRNIFIFRFNTFFIVFANCFNTFFIALIARNYFMNFNPYLQSNSKMLVFMPFYHSLVDNASF